MAVLGSIYIFFKPLNIKQHIYVDVPLFELKEFTLYELEKSGMHTMMLGSEATRYKNRYTVKDIDYTDNSKEYIANMKAKNGLYKNNLVTLRGDVTYVREDGLTFQTQEAKYNKRTTNIVSTVGYVAYLNGSTIKGTYIRYNNNKNRVFSKNVQAKIQLKESK